MKQKPSFNILLVKSPTIINFKLLNELLSICTPLYSNSIIYITIYIVIYIVYTIIYIV